MTLIGLFTGIGGFRPAASASVTRRVWAPGNDAEVAKACGTSFPITPAGCIRQARVRDVPPRDLLCAGFPCRPFPVIGNLKGAGSGNGRGTPPNRVVRTAKAGRPRAMPPGNARRLRNGPGRPMDSPV